MGEDYRDREYSAGAKFTNQSESEGDGVTDAAARHGNVENEDIVVWTVFGLTHHPRVKIRPSWMK